MGEAAHLQHHLFPSICHINNPGISKVVEETCREFGVKYAEHRVFLCGTCRAGITASCGKWEGRGRRLHKGEPCGGARAEGIVRLRDRGKGVVAITGRALPGS